MAYPDEVLADSPWLYWRLDETSGVTAADTSGNGRTGTYNGSPTLVQSPLINEGTSVFFDATNDYLLSDGGVIFIQSTATVEVWFDYDGTPPASGVFSLVAGVQQGDGLGNGDKLLMIDDAGHAVFYVFDGAAKLATSSAVLSAGTYHLVGTVNATTATIYVDGVSDGTIGASGSFTGFGSPNVMVGGDSTARGAGPGPHRKAGRRDEFAIYTTDLSSARILAHYQAGAPEEAGPQVLSMQSHVFGHNRW